MVGQRLEAAVTFRSTQRRARLRFGQQLQQELETTRREAADARAAREQAERAGMENYAERVKSDVVSAKAALVAAKQAQDTTAEVEAASKLAKASAAEADVDAWRASNPKEQPTQQRQQPQEQQRQQPQRQQEAAPLSEPVRNFMQDNSWFNAVEIGTDGRPVIDPTTRQQVANPDFDPEMHDAAILEHNRIALEIRRGKLPKDYVETPEYFDRIAKQVAADFPEAFEGEETQAPKPRTPPMSQGRQPVAPAQRTSQPGAPRTSGTKMTLDGEQAEFVRSLVDNGTMKYPRDHTDATKRGQKMSYNDAYLQYAKNLKTDQANRSQN